MYNSPFIRELVANAIDRLDIAWLSRVSLDLAAQIFNVGINAAVKTAFGHAMQSVDQLGTAKGLAWVLRQRASA